MLDHLVNEAITAKEVRLIGEQGEQVGVISTRDALYRARQAGMDLVAIQQAPIPVVKILNYEKFKYNEAKRVKELAKKARMSKVEIKEIQLRPVTEIHDIQIKAKKAQEFLEDGNKVKVVIKFRGREVSHAEMGKQVIESFLSLLKGFKFDRPIGLSGREMSTVLAALPQVPVAVVQTAQTAE